MQIVKIIVLGLAAILVSACAQTGGTASGQTQTAGPSVVGVLIQSRVKQKGPEMFCSQPAYVNCLGVEKQQCLSELNSVQDKCYNVAIEKSAAGSNSALFTSHYTSCMTINHGLLHPERVTQISSCVQGASLNYAAMLQSILY